MSTEETGIPPINFDRTVSRLLHYFLAVAEELSFSKAARRLNMSQPPLSLHIKALEHLLGTQLFLRDSRNVELTAAGALLLKETSHIQGLTRQSLRQVGLMGRGAAGHIKLGLVGTAAWGALLPALRTFCEGGSGIITWSVEEMTPERQVAALLGHHIDIGVWREVRQEDLGKTLVCQLIEREQLMVACPSHHIFSVTGDEVALTALREEAFISLAPSPLSIGSYVIRMLSQHGISPKIVQTVVEPQTALALVSKGCGMTLLPESYARIGWPGVRFCSLAGDISANLYAVSNPKTLIPVARRFLDSLKDHITSSGPNL